MIIPEIDHALATIKATDIQINDDFHLSENDYAQFWNAIRVVTKLGKKVKARQQKIRG